MRRRAWTNFIFISLPHMVNLCSFNIRVGKETPSSKNRHALGSQGAGKVTRPCTMKRSVGRRRLLTAVGDADYDDIVFIAITEW
ncbi:jg19841 [Pararge aegeria aegeria]|uniref:Jg19841 protein n=1 Tax=Pararge aegeria aegeria TaxID=348720 RepID=A0A8S4SJB6_9NEOP|nr:jg19841 [Pararge aegeria aegeria]